MAWKTPLDRVFSQKVLFYAFVGIIVGTTAVTLFSDSKIGNSAAVLDTSTQGNSQSLTLFKYVVLIVQTPRTGRFTNLKVGCERYLFVD
jgi:hypothetical protein